MAARLAPQVRRYACLASLQQCCHSAPPSWWRCLSRNRHVVHASCRYHRYTAHAVLVQTTAMPDHAAAAAGTLRTSDAAAAAGTSRTSRLLCSGMPASQTARGGVQATNGKCPGRSPQEPPPVDLALHAAGTLRKREAGTLRTGAGARKSRKHASLHRARTRKFCQTGKR